LFKGKRFIDLIGVMGHHSYCQKMDEEKLQCWWQ